MRVLGCGFGYHSRGADSLAGYNNMRVDLSLTGQAVCFTDARKHLSYTGETFLHQHNDFGWWLVKETRQTESLNDSSVALCYPPGTGVGNLRPVCDSAVQCITGL